MSQFDYAVSRDIEAKDYPFYALIMAAMRKADSVNSAKLRRVFPDVWAELQERYNAPGGLLSGEVAYRCRSGEEPPGCQGICTKDSRTGVIVDPDCFR